MGGADAVGRAHFGCDHRPAAKSGIDRQILEGLLGSAGQHVAIGGIVEEKVAVGIVLFLGIHGDALGAVSLGGGFHGGGAFGHGSLGVGQHLDHLRFG